MNIWDEIKWLIIVSGLPCIGFVFGILFSFLIYPYNVEAASEALIIFSGTGAFLGMFIVIHRIILLLNRRK